ncbi:MAG: hypothetical protein J7K40_07865 [candidate division Zixibacteria bacterium]|nr:hypothetical protein [candidate division Zixibacteria bacterium]
MRANKTIMIIIILSLLSGSTHALNLNPFNNQRKDFIFDVGYGLGFTKVSSEYYGISSNTIKGAFDLEGKIGFAPNNQFRVYMVNKMSIFDVPKMVDDYGNYFDKM